MGFDDFSTGNTMNKDVLKTKLLTYMESDDLSELGDHLWGIPTIPSNAPDMENMQTEPWGSEECDIIMGLKETRDGFGYIGLHFGGDWEHPAHAILLWSEQVQSPVIYIVRDGNMYNWEEERPYDNEEDEDILASLDFDFPKLIASIDEMVAKYHSKT